MAQIAFIGLGVMGLRMAKRLISSGHGLVAYDIDRKPVDALVEAGARAAASPAEGAAASDVVISMLPTPAVTKEVMLGEGGVGQALRPGSVYLDMSTSDPLLSREICEVLARRGVEMLDAPVSGGMEGALEGTLAIMVGGKEEVFEQVLPILGCMGKKVYYIGGIGSGHTIKLINNMLFSVVMAATGEALAFGQKSGIDMTVLRDVMNASSGRSYALDVKVRDFVIPQNFTPGFTVDLQVKDVDLALKLGKDLGVPLLLATLVRQAYQAILLKGYGKKDTSIVTKFFEEISGIQTKP